VGLTVEELAAATDVSAGRILALEAGQFVSVLAVSSLQGYLHGLTGIDIREEPA
jgi:hypothetical protein